MDKPNVLVPSFGLSHSFHPAHYPDPLFSPSCRSLPPHPFDSTLSILRSFCVFLCFVVYIDGVTPASTHSFGRTLSFFFLPLLFSGIWSSLFYGLLRSFSLGFVLPTSLPSFFLSCSCHHCFHSFIHFYHYCFALRSEWVLELGLLNIRHTLLCRVMSLLTRAGRFSFLAPSLFASVLCVRIHYAHRYMHPPTSLTMLVLPPTYTHRLGAV
jgi:hypothetical protein